MKILTIEKNEKIKFEAYIFNDGHIIVKKAHTRYENMVRDVLKNNFKNKALCKTETIEVEDLESGEIYNHKKEIYKEEDLAGDTPLEKLETFFEQFNELYNYELKKEDMYKCLIGRESEISDIEDICKKDNIDIGFPMNIESLIKHLGIKFTRRTDFRNMSLLGKASLTNNVPAIWINTVGNENHGRKRFTMAHELGHVLKDILPKMKHDEEIEDFEIEDTKETLEFFRGNGSNQIEVRANKFSANFLMPKEKVAEYYDLYCGLEEDEMITTMAEYFQVSRAAMEIRLKVLGKI